MDRTTGIFVDGIGTAASTSGVLSPLEGRIFALLYVHDTPLPLEEIATRLEQSKSHVSVNIRRLLEWHLVRRVPVPGSRKDHYEAATDFLRVVQEIAERRFRWCIRQVLATLTETERALATDGDARESAPFVRGRLSSLRLFFSAIDAGFGAFTQGKPLDPAALASVLTAVPTSRRHASKGGSE